MMFQWVILKHSKKLDENRDFPEYLKQRFWRQYNHVCQICNKKIQYQNVTLDHIVPWLKGGKTEESNAQLAHKACNQRKRDKIERCVIT